MRLFFFCNEKRVMQTHEVIYVCRLVSCIDCGGVGHDMEQCRKKRFEVDKVKIKPKIGWVPKTTQVTQLIPV